MGSGSGFERQEEESARRFAAAARGAGLEGIVYLGGLGDEREDLSPHLRSRQQVGRILRGSGVPTLELRASIVIGSGSLSFEMIRALTEKLPLLIMPRWVEVEAQPIGIEDLVAILLEAVDLKLAESRVVENGGADVLSYRALMAEYTRQRGLRRWMIPVPVLTPGLSSLWLGLVTPLYARVGRKLIDSIRHPTVVRDPAAAALFHTRPRGAAEAISDALRDEERAFAQTRWSDAVSSSGSVPSYGGLRVGTRLVDQRCRHVDTQPAAAFAPIAGLGGAAGWYSWNLLWRLRGWLDLLTGGVGMRRGRPIGRPLRAGDPLDFWRV